MKRKVFTAIILVLTLTLAAASFTACNNQPFYNTVSAVWKDYERFEYDVTVADSDEKGTFTAEISIIRSTDVEIGGIKLQKASGHYYESRLEIGDTVIREELLFGAINQSQNLTPVLSARSVTRNGVTTVTTVNYKDGVARFSDGGEDFTDVKLSTPYYDNSQIYILMRATGSANFTYKAMIPAEKQAVALKCAAGASVQVSCPYSETPVACYSMTVSRDEKLTGSPFTAFYASTAFTVDGKSVINALVKFVEGDVTYTLKNISLTK